MTTLFSDIAEKQRANKQASVGRIGQRKYVWYCADQLNLAAYHQRPQYEIDALTERLRLATAHPKES